MKFDMSRFAAKKSDSKQKKAPAATWRRGPCIHERAEAATTTRTRALGLVRALPISSISRIRTAQLKASEMTSRSQGELEGRVLGCTGAPRRTIRRRALSLNSARWFLHASLPNKRKSTTQNTGGRGLVRAPVPTNHPTSVEQIIKQFFQRSLRLWQFDWNGSRRWPVSPLRDTPSVFFRPGTRPQPSQVPRESSHGEAPRHLEAANGHGYSKDEGSAGRSALVPHAGFRHRHSIQIHVFPG
jgi:hypothetical protein